MKKRLISLFLSLALLCACLPQAAPIVHAREDAAYALADSVEPGKTYVIVADGKYALTNRQEGLALRDYDDDAITTLASAPVTVSGGVLTGEITEDMLWTVEESTAPEATDGMVQYFLRDVCGCYLRRGSSSDEGAQLLVEPELNAKLRYNTWSFYPLEAGTWVLYCNSSRSFDKDAPFYLYANETSFDSPSHHHRSESKPFAFVDNDDCSRIQLFEVVGFVPCAHEYTEQTVAPTCETRGCVLHTCTICGRSYGTDFVDRLSHEWSEEGVVTKQATDTERGELTFTCARCGGTKVRPIAAGTEKAHKNEILFISDLHSGRYAEKGYHNLRAMFGLLREYDDFVPEVVCGGGDYLESRTYDAVDWPRCYEALHDIMYEASPDTAHALTSGNHDWEWSLQSDEMIEKLLGVPRVGNSYSSEDFEIFQIGAHTNSGSKEHFQSEDIAKLRAFLASVAGSGKVIFIQTHWPLHYGYNSDTWRTTKNADDMIALLNEYSDRLDIVFVWGHNHNEDETRHKCMVRGDTLQYAKSEYAKIQFTYVNAGCLNERHAKEGAGPEGSKYGPGYLLEARILGDRLILDYGHITGAYPDPSQAKYDHNADLLYVPEIEEARESHFEIQLLHRGVCEHDYQAAVTAPTCTEAGFTTYTCAKCGESYVADEVPALGHDLTAHEAKAPTCTESGYAAYETCSRCDYSTYTEIAALGHDLTVHAAQAPTCTEPGWDAYETCARCDYTTYKELAALGHDLTVHAAKAPTCKEAGWDAYETCTRCDYSTYKELAALGHALTVHAAKAPTCTETGWDAYETCTRCDYSTYKELAALGHNYREAVTAPTCTEAGFTTCACTRCGDSYTGNETAALGHDWGEGVVTKEPTETSTGVRTYTCSRCGQTRTELIPALSHTHKYNAVVTPPTCTDAGYTTHTCACGDSYTDTPVPALGHDYRGVVTAPTCTEPGYTTYICTVCGETYTGNETDALGHDFQAAVTDPTCTEAGYTTYTCAVCGETYTGNETDALGHDFQAAVTAPTCTEAGYTTYTCAVCGETYTGNETDALGHDYRAAVTVPTCTEGGYTTYTCSVCGDSYVGDHTAALEHDYQDGVCTRCGQKDPDYEPPAPFCFDDVQDESQYYFDPVYWAVDKGVTTGATPTTFNPGAGCTRAQVVTFLWRAAGKPEPAKTDNPFNDVQPDAYYYKAVLWAVEKGITTGTSATTFRPDQTCTRGQIVTFLWRYNNQPEPTKTDNPFTDVQTSQYYCKAILWAIEKGITKGTSADKFSPDSTCTRAQIVTFLYRAEQE